MNFITLKFVIKIAHLTANLQLQSAALSAKLGNICFLVFGILYKYN